MKDKYADNIKFRLMNIKNAGHIVNSLFYNLFYGKPSVTPLQVL